MSDRPNASRPIPAKFALRGILAGAAAVGMVFCSPAAVWAENLDLELLKQADKIIGWMEKKGHKTVGVLKFRSLLPGKTTPSFFAGSLNANLAERLENALVMKLAEGSDIRVLHDAGDVIAAQGRQLYYLVAGHRKQMFALKYATAWGNDQLPANVFLTGVVRIDPAAEKPIAISILAFDRTTVGEGDKVAFEPVATIYPKGETGLLADLGVGRRSRDPKTPLADFDPKDMAEIAFKDSQIDIQISFGGKRYYPNSDNVFPIPQQDNEPVYFQVKNKSDRKLAIVLKVNGLNTLDLEEKEFQYCRPWVLTPGMEYGIQGYHISKKGSETFAADWLKGFDRFDDSKLGPNDFALLRLLTKSGRDWEVMSAKFPAPRKVDMAVFISDPRPPLPVMKISLRGFGKYKEVSNRGQLSLDDLQGKLNRQTGFKLERDENGLAVMPPVLQRLEFDEFPNPRMVEHIHGSYKRDGE